MWAAWRQGIAGSAGASARHWSRLPERGSRLGLRTMLATYRCFGRTAFKLLLRPAVLYFLIRNGAARRASLDFLARVHAHPEGCRTVGQMPGWRAAYRHFLSFGEAILDKVAAWIGHIPMTAVSYERRDLLEQVEQGGRGAVLIASHLGNLEVCRALGQTCRSLRLNVLVHTRHAQAFNRLLEETDARATVALLQIADFGIDTAIMLGERVARGELVVIVADRTPVTGHPRSVATRFLGADAHFPVGPFVLAALLGCPVLMIFCIKQGDRFRIIFEHFADRLELPRRNRAAAIQAAVARYAARLEHHAVRHPYQWFNFFDFWAPAAPPRARPDARR